MQYLLFCCANREKCTDIHAVQMFNAVTTFPIQPLKIARQRTHQRLLVAIQVRCTLEGYLAGVNLISSVCAVAELRLFAVVLLTILLVSGL